MTLVHNRCRFADKQIIKLQETLDEIPEGDNALRLPFGANFGGDINILLVGDPGPSKPQLLQYMHKLSPRGIYTSGRGNSAVGLTAYVVKDPETGETVLESGVLVLSDKGVCCIDEFDKMSNNARSMLHEVMEQQTVSSANAGIIASLNARTGVLACASPCASRYNPRLLLLNVSFMQASISSCFKRYSSPCGFEPLQWKIAWALTGVLCSEQWRF